MLQLSKIYSEPLKALTVSVELLSIKTKDLIYKRPEESCYRDLWLSKNKYDCKYTPSLTVELFFFFAAGIFFGSLTNTLQMFGIFSSFFV